ncbi:hypothetical protein BGZ83_007369 [Gryganskiella cystojenkinii]|nr:hypothetical protein BGZ83_007369 [Gryganskiella cystojenkinii]
MSTNPPHSGVPTTTGQVEVAPENLITRGYPKRSLAALETEFVESNDINAMAPSSAVLQSDYLIMDDAHNLDERVDMADSVPPTSSSSSSSSSSTTAATGGPAAKRLRYTKDNSPILDADLAQLKPVIQPRKSISGDASNDHTTAPSQQQKPRSSSISWARSVSDLVPPSSHLAPVYLDEANATKVFGEPIDSSSTKLALGGHHGRGEQQHSTSMDIDSSEGDKQGSSGTHSSAAGSSSVSSSIFLPPHPQPHSGEHRRSISRESSSSGTPSNHSNNATTKKGVQRPVRIQLIDEVESSTLQERAKRDSAIQEEEEQEDDKELEKEEESLVTGNRQRRNQANDDSEGLALPKEDPMVHDWDREELDDDQSGTEPSSQATSGTSSPAAPFASSQRRRSIENDIRRASGHATSSSSSQPTHSSHLRKSRRKKDVDDDNEDEDDRDSLMDPEREVAMMSEDQEAELHNMHLRLENQREFQDVAGLDLGEEDAQAVNEDGQYGGVLEDDDEGEDYWENR